MTKAAFDKTAAGLGDAMAFAEGDQTRGRVVAPTDVRSIRAATGKSQSEFAASFRLPIGTLRDWEQNRRQPDAPARVLLSLIEIDPLAVEALVARATGNRTRRDAARRDQP